MKINFKKYIKTILILGVVFVGLGAGYFLVLAQVVSDSFANLNFVADTWRTTVDTSGGGRVTLEEKSCDDDNWFCAGVESCANTLGDGD